MDQEVSPLIALLWFDTESIQLSMQLTNIHLSAGSVVKDQVIRSNRRILSYYV